mgnify:CR=1 FL=1
MDKGIIQIYYGEGQGKTSAALGNAIRKASNGQSAYVVQFMKGQLDTEYLTRLEPEVKVFRFERCSEGFDALDEAEKQEQQALRAEYIADFRKNLKSQLDNTVVINPDGTSYRLRQDKSDK